MGFFLLYLPNGVLLDIIVDPSRNSVVILSLSGSVSLLSETDVLRRFPSAICRKQ